MDETITQTEEQNGIASPKEPQTVKEDDNAAAPAEKTVSKDIFDKKVSEMNKQIKALKSELAARMTDDEKAAAEQNETARALQEAKNELSMLRTESALTSAGISSEISKNLSKVIISGETEGIVEAVTAALKANAADTEARVRRDILEKGSPRTVKVGEKEAEDPDLEIVKRIAKPAEQTPLEKSKWY